MSLLSVDRLPPELLRYAQQKFQALFELHPSERAHVILKDKTDLPVHRWQQTYLHTPTYDPRVQKSYMFSGRDQLKQRPDMPAEFQPFLDFVRTLDPRMNQMVVNWYAGNSQDHIAMHSDYMVGTPDDAKIVVISLSVEGDVPRVFCLESRNDPDDKLEVPMVPGTVLTMTKESQTKYRHGVPPSEAREPRISLTFRSFLS